MKVAIVHYWFISRRGGEKVVETMLKIFPEADIYTLFYDKESYGDFLENQDVHTSILNHPILRKHYQKIFPLYPLGINSLKLKKNYDLVISSESGPAKGIKIEPKVPHICYIHTPMRYCWGFTDEYLKSIPKIARPLTRFLFQKLKEWDKTTIENVDYYIANSLNVQNRVKKFYNKESSVIHPPIELKLFDNQNSEYSFGDFYLSFGAITPYKRIDLLVDTFNSNGKKLIVIGSGSETKKLIKKAKSNIQFLGALPWTEIEKLIVKSKALLFPGEEDFGMVPLEIMAYGIPVIAYEKGGALETVIENVDDIKSSTGLFFKEQTVDSLNIVIEKFEKIQLLFDPEFIKFHARKFGEDIFIENFKKFLVEKKLVEKNYFDHLNQ